MIGLNNGDKIRGDAAAANEVDYLIVSFIGETPTNLADGQLPAAIGDLYTAGADGIGISSIILVNTGAVARAVNLYLTPNGGTARRLIDKDYSLAAGKGLWTDGKSARLLDAGAGGNGIGAHNILDGSDHPDSVVQAVTRGSIIVGSPTPKWDELVIGAADRFFGSDGTDPSWVQVSHTVLSNKGEPFTEHLNNPCARVRHSAHQAIPHNTYTILAMDTEDFDTDTIHDLVVNNSRLTCKTAGIYLVTAGAQWFQAAGGRREIDVLLNGVNAILMAEIGSVADATCYPGLFLCCLYDFQVNDYVELRAYQTSGGAVNICGGVTYSPIFMMGRVG